MMVNTELNQELVRVIKGINMLSRVKEDIKDKLELKIKSEKVDKVFNEEIEVSELNQDEQYHFLKVIFEFAKDEKFNPVLIEEANNINDTNANNNEENDEDKPKKDDIPELYYDFELKSKFANKYPSNTKRVIMALFRRTAQIEKGKAKDLCNFNIEELSLVFKSLKAKSLRSLQNTISTVERYVEFAEKQGKTDYKINYAKAFNSKKKIESLINKDAVDNMIFERDELMEMALNTDNAQDGVILGLLFDGVSHKNEFEELVELTIDDCELDEKKINLKGRQEPIDISHETKMLIQDAYDQEKYLSITGETARKYKIAEGKNILRGLRGKAKVKSQIINQRILRIKEIFGYEYLNATSVSYSGQVDYAKRLIEIEGKSIDETIPMVLKKFGLSDNSSSHFYLKTRIEKYLDLNK
jgi:hypothetical protein